MFSQQPRPWEEIVAMLLSVGAAIGLGKLIFGKRERVLYWREVGREALAHAGLAAAAAIPLFYFKDANPAAVVGLGVLLATLGIRGIHRLIRSWRGSRK